MMRVEEDRVTRSRNNFKLKIKEFSSEEGHRIEEQGVRIKLGSCWMHKDEKKGQLFDQLIMLLNINTLIFKWKINWARMKVFALYLRIRSPLRSSTRWWHSLSFIIIPNSPKYLLILPPPIMNWWQHSRESWLRRISQLIN